ncbi:hypothetical protein [Rubrivirga sp. IMCC43871]|uniref:hypothetical protein n=1 Tax=Rubrivirga sp. IMCC43871 TaxID=3391575 RepID=UPI00398FEEA2
MTASPLPLVLALAGAVAYHLAQKAVPETAAPFVVIGLAYAVGLLACLGAVVALGSPVAETLRDSWRPGLGIGLGALVIEAGFLLAYRAGWPLSTASLGVNVAVAVVLLVVGVLAYGEALTPRQWTGLVACGVGLLLLAGR